MKKYLALSLTLLLALALIVSVSAAGDKTVVYLKDGGSGDGSSPEAAVSDLFTAYDALDLSKDCTIVVCGVFTQHEAFSYMVEYTGSVTFTSLYGGTDYRTSGAAYYFDPARFVCWGATTFEQMDFVANGKNLLVIGQHNPLKVGEGVTMTGEKMTGGNIASAFCLMGGYQNGQDEPPFESDKDTNITVLSGSKMYILPFSRQIMGIYTGTANIYIGGNADVTVLHCTSAYPDGIEVGDLKVTITDNAAIKNIYGCTQDTTINSVEFTWNSGTIGLFEWVCSYTPGKLFTCNTPTKLIASKDVQATDMFATIAANFDTVETLGAAPSTPTTPAVTTAAPVVTTPAPVETTAAPVVTTAAPVVTTAAPVVTTPAPVETTAAPVETTAAPVATTAAPAQTTAAPTTTAPAEGGASVGVIIGIVAAVVVVVAVLAIVLKKKKA